MHENLNWKNKITYDGRTHVDRLMWKLNLDIFLYAFLRSSQKPKNNAEELCLRLKPSAIFVENFDQRKACYCVWSDSFFVMKDHLIVVCRNEEMHPEIPKRLYHIYRRSVSLVFQKPRNRPQCMLWKCHRNFFLKLWKVLWKP